MFKLLDQILFQYMQHLFYITFFITLRRSNYDDLDVESFLFYLMNMKIDKHMLYYSLSRKHAY